MTRATDPVARTLAGTALVVALVGTCGGAARVLIADTDSGEAPIGAGLFEPATEAACTVGEATLHSVMEDGIGPALSALSFHLHHDRTEGRLDGVLAQTAVLAGCARVAGSFPPRSRGHHTVHFQSELQGLRDDTVALQQSALMGNQSASLHWFEHLRARCDSCHAFFIAQSTP